MFHGSMVAIVTPMEPDGVIDVDSLRNLIEWHIEQGTHGIVILGSTGESPTINPQERQLIIQQAREQIKERVPLIVGTGTNSTDLSIHYTREAMELGADACLLITPYYNKPTQEGLYLHFKAVADAVPIPQILYNCPSRTACDLKPETIARLVHLPNIIGLKEAVGDLQRLKEILAFSSHVLDVYSGDDATGLDFLLAGARGVISVTANVAPQLMRKMCDAALAGDTETAHQINEKLAGFHKLQGVETNPIPVKWALHIMGMIPKGIRLPLTPLSETYHDAVREALMPFWQEHISYSRNTGTASL
ncbi:MAG TPA: 4-hydroxy-tetrahydrodipicolinate synthase [Gammaproteobacteria bacterium]|nr:4-hydroxy-tetrahydrodipicolinate synthase [Gammaproteobacteria bacterium]